MDVVRAIAAVPTDWSSDQLAEGLLAYPSVLLISVGAQDPDERPRVSCAIVGCGEARAHEAPVHFCAGWRQILERLQPPDRVTW